MPLVPSTYRAPFLLRNGHLQTILPALRRRKVALAYERERLELADGDFLDLGWARQGNGRVAIITHGLEGDVRAGYVRGMASALNAGGWDALAWNFRGCGPEPNRLLRFYHSGETGDLRLVIEHAAARYARLALVGFSLGGNLTLKYLGEAPPHPAVRGAAAISAPVDLASSAGLLDRRIGNRIYLRRFIKTLIAKVEAKAVRYPAALDLAGIRAIRTFQEFDDRYTSVIHGFRDAAEYWAQCSSRQYLARLTIPALLLNALDDPFLSPDCFPFGEASASAFLFLETPRHGGHVGFGELGRVAHTWAERRVVEFLT